MKKLEFSKTINASKERVWNALWTDEAYKQWAAAFYEGAYAVTDWKEGSKVQFLSPGGEGMSSTIAKAIPNEFMSFRHEGVVKNNKEQPNDPESKKWKGATEKYTLRESGGVTTLKVEVDVAEEYEDQFSKAFPEALKRVKQMAESKVMSEAE
jgi:uncharacterized protein YndB with AHSA1/START domain